MAGDTGKSAFWKWVAGLMASLVVSNCITAFVFGMSFRVSDEDIRDSVRRTFTEVSRNHGLYAIEGQPHIQRLEDKFETLVDLMADIRSDIAVIKNKLDNSQGD